MLCKSYTLYRTRHKIFKNVNIYSNLKWWKPFIGTIFAHHILYYVCVEDTETRDKIRNNESMLFSINEEKFFICFNVILLIYYIFRHGLPSQAAVEELGYLNNETNNFKICIFWNRKEDHVNLVICFAVFMKVYYENFKIFFVIIHIIIIMFPLTMKSMHDHPRECKFCCSMINK